MDEHLFVGQRHQRQTYSGLSNVNRNNINNTNDVDRENINVRPNQIHRRHRENASTHHRTQRRRMDGDDDEDRTQEFIHLENPRPPILRKTNLYVDVNNVASTSTASNNSSTRTNFVDERRAPIHLPATTIDDHQRNQERVNNNNQRRRIVGGVNNNTGITSSTSNHVLNNNNIFFDDNDGSGLTAFVPHRSEVIIVEDSSKRNRRLNDHSRTVLLNSDNNDGDFHKIPKNNNLISRNRTTGPGRSVRLINPPSFSSDCVNSSNAIIVAPSSNINVITSQPTKKLNDGHRTNLPTIICRECNKCRCQACMTPRPLPSKYICNRRCLCSAENVVDWLSCYKTVKCCWYHLDELDADDEGYGGGNHRHNGNVDDDQTCKCLPSTSSTSNCLLKCTCLSASLVLLPCLWCYPALKCCSWLCFKCYSRYHDNGCRCNPRRVQYASAPTTTPASQTKILPPPFAMRTTALDGSATTTSICSPSTMTDRHLLKLHMEPP